VLPVKYEVDMYPGSSFTLTSPEMTQNLDFSLLVRFYLSNSSARKCAGTKLSYSKDLYDLTHFRGIMIDELVMDGYFVLFNDEFIINQVIKHIGFFRKGDSIAYHFALNGDSLDMQNCSYSIELSALEPVSLKLNESIQVDLVQSPYYNSNRSTRFTTENVFDANKSLLINVKLASDSSCLYRLIGNGNESLSIFGLETPINEF
jgi:hypothetical protein